MRRTVASSRVIRAVFSGIAALLVVYLALLALWPTLADSLPAALRFTIRGRRIAGWCQPARLSPASLRPPRQSVLLLLSGCTIRN